MYDVNYFIQKFEEIPEILWCVRQMKDGDKYCALGHCGGLMNQKLYGKAEALVRVIFNGSGFGVFQINDFPTNQYPQKTAKQRILAALYDIRDKELSEANVKEASKLINENNCVSEVC